MSNLKIISDGTAAGTRLIDEDSGEMIHLVQSIFWKATSDDFLTKTSIKILNVPVEIITKATILLKKFSEESGDFEDAGQIEKLIRIVSLSTSDIGHGTTLQEVFIYDAETNTPIPGVLEAIFKVDTSDGIQARLTQVLFNEEYGTKISAVEERGVAIEPIDRREFGDVLTKIYDGH